MSTYRPESVLGKYLGSRIKTGKEILVALESYFDGSSIGEEWGTGKWITLAGFAAEESIWRQFDTDWNNILAEDKDRPKAAYLHMVEASKGSGEFTWRNGWNSEKVGILITDLLKYMQKLDKQRFCQFACTIDLEAHRKLKAEGYKFHDPVRMCNDWCPEAVLTWYATKYPGIISSLSFFFDKSEPFEKKFRKRWKKQTENILDITGTQVFWSLIKTITSADMKDTPALQAADLLAWGSNRAASTEPGEALFQGIELAMKAVIPSNWQFLDEARLRLLYSQER